MVVSRTLLKTDPFGGLPEEVVDELAAAAITREYPAHSLIFKQHDPPTGYLYVVSKGLVEIVALTPGGVEMVVDYRREGSFFGGTPVFTGDNYTAGARTVTATTCLLISQKILNDVGRRYPHIIELFTRTILSRVRDLYSDMVADHARTAAAPIEAYPFQKRLVEIMSTPVETCPPDTPVREVARRMAARGIGAIVVESAAGKVAGIITRKDLVSKVVAPAMVDCNTLTAAEVMTKNPLVMPVDAYMFEASTFLMTHKIRHLPVVAGDRLVGIVTLRDLMRFRSQKSMLLINSIKEAKSLDDLAKANAQIVQVAKAFMAEARSHFEIMEILSYIHHTILRRCFELILDEFRRQGMTPPAIRFCLMIMGSGGRKEMLLGPDQDNGLVFEDYPDAMQAEVDAFFVPFSERLIQAFEEVGYPLCNGRVMANNPRWRGRLKDWQKRIDGWIQVPDPKMIMYSTIFLDFMPLAGDPSLCQDLREILHHELEGNTVYLYYLLENDLKHAPPLNLLGRFIVEKSGPYQGQLSIKQAGSVFIVDCVRMFLLEKGVDATTTLDRLNELVRLKVFNQETAENLRAALEVFIFFRLRQEISLIEQGEQPSHYITPSSLSKNEQELLAEAFRSVAKLQDSARRHFGRGLR